MNRTSTLTRKTALKSGGRLNRSSLRPKKTARAKKMELKRTIIEQYGLPQIEHTRWGTGKAPTRTDILKGMLWTVFSRFIRQRDRGKCIACGMPKTYEELQAGHYAPVGGNDIELCFDEQNVNGECEYCNAFDSFHLIPMRRNLIAKYGEGVVLDIERRRERKQAIKWDESVFVDKILFYHSQLNV